MSDEELIEKLAAIEHMRWADWQKWCHKVLRENNPSPEQGDILERWDRQIETPYSELTETEKQADRDQVMRYWPLIQEYIASQATKPSIPSSGENDAALRETVVKCLRSYADAGSYVEEQNVKTIMDLFASQATAAQEGAIDDVEDIERLLLRWRFDDLQDKKAAEIAEMLASLKKEGEL